nr:GDSL-type esterase/lipase family protein [Armatimonas rosea]
MWVLPRIQGRACVTRGVGRQTTAQALGRLEGDVLRWKPSCVVLECGINDLRALPLLPERRVRLKEDCVANLAKMVETLRKHNIPVVLCTIFPVQTPKPWQEPFWSDGIAGLVRETNTELRKLGREGVQILETEPVLAAADGKIRAELATDHLHLSPAGYERLNERLVLLLKSP